MKNNFSLLGLNLFVLIALGLSYYVISSYYRPVERYRLLSFYQVPLDGHTLKPCINYAIVFHGDPLILLYYDSPEYESLDYLIEDYSAAVKSGPYFSERMNFRIPNSKLTRLSDNSPRTTPEMEEEFNAIVQYVRKDIIKDDKITIEEFLQTHGK